METTVKRRSPQISSGSLYNKRRHPRVEVQGFVGDIADGNLVLAGTVEDVSSGGFKMSNLPKSFTAANQSYTTVISGNGKHYKVIVVPCWTRETDSNRSVEVGFKIIQASWEWIELILDFASPSTLDDDFGFQA
jgi:hypothetical protein